MSKFDVLVAEVERVREATRAQFALIPTLHTSPVPGCPDPWPAAIEAWEKAMADLILAAYELGRRDG